MGEFVDSIEEANERTEECVVAIETIKKEGLDAELSLKMTSLGMDISRELVMNNMRKVLDAGKNNAVFVTIDMEDSPRCQETLDIFEQLLKEYPNGVGTVLRSMLYRSGEDVEYFKQYTPKIRFVKGAYKEPESVAYQVKSDVDENYKVIIKQHLSHGNIVQLGSHDEKMVAYGKQLLEEMKLDKEMVEFQMLFGLRSEFQEQIAKDGYKMRVYLPSGTDWYGYFMRRLAERPANVG